MMTLQSTDHFSHIDVNLNHTQQYNECLVAQSTSPSFNYDVNHSDTHEYEECLKDCIFYYKNLHIEQLQKIKDINEVPKHMFFAKLYLTIHKNQKFEKKPSEYLDKFIKKWDSTTYGNEVAKQEFFKNIYEKFMKLAYWEK